MKNTKSKSDFLLNDSCISETFLEPTCSTGPGAINGGLLPKVPTGEHPVIVIDVPSVEKHIKKVESASGKTVMPVMKIGEFGLYARVSDTEDNVIDIWQTLVKC
jgi:predicted enzyme related to lactoylglutathione lyase